MRIRETYRRLDRSLVRAAIRARRAAFAGDAVLDVVIGFTGFSRAEIEGPGRSRGVSYARHLAMYCLHEYARLGPSEIGRMLGERDHTTVLGGMKRVGLERTWRAETRRDLEQIHARIERRVEAVSA